MATNPETGATFVGGGSLHQVDLTTGVTSSPTGIAGNPDLREVEFTLSRSRVFGTRCSAGGFVRPLPYGNGQPLVVSSVNHEPNCFGVQILSFSETLPAGQPLPINLDPLLGTSGCRLNVSIDFTVLAFANSSGSMSVTTPLPPALAFFQFYVQHAAFETAPGGMTWTTGLRVRPGRSLAWCDLRLCGGDPDRLNACIHEFDVLLQTAEKLGSDFERTYLLDGKAQAVLERGTSNDDVEARRIYQEALVIARNRGYDDRVAEFERQLRALEIKLIGQD